LLAKILKGFTGQSFSKVIRKLFLGIDLLNLNVAVGDMMPEVVPFHTKIFGAGRDALVCGKSESAVVVFEDGTLDGGFEGIAGLKNKHQLKDEFTKWKELPHGLAQGRVFTLKSA
jgi:hypothetical protein